MNIVPLRDGTLLAFFRSRWADRIYREPLAVTTDAAGRAPVPTELPNNNSSIQVTRLCATASSPLVFNDSNAEGITERRLSLYDDIEDDDRRSRRHATAPGRRQAIRAKDRYWGAPGRP